MKRRAGRCGFCLTSFAAPGDGVLVHSPTYIGFTRSLEGNGYKIVHSPLKKDDNGVWRMDTKIWTGS